MDKIPIKKVMRLNARPTDVERKTWGRMNGQCSVCEKADDPSLLFEHECGHFSHALCLRQARGNVSNSYATCNWCLKGETPVAPIAAPVAEPKPGLFSRLFARSTTLRDLVATGQMPEDMTYATLCNEGVNISHLLTGRYGLDQILAIPGLGGPRCLSKFKTLGMNANHLRSCSDLLPIDGVVKATGEKSKLSLLIQLGLVFPSGCGLACDGDGTWTAQDCLDLGLGFQDLKQLGLKSRVQYDSLFSPEWTEPQSQRIDQELGATAIVIGQLEDYPKPEEPEERLQESYPYPAESYSRPVEHYLPSEEQYLPPRAAPLSFAPRHFPPPSAPIFTMSQIHGYRRGK
jgi:hypothetical protein